MMSKVTSCVFRLCKSCSRNITPSFRYLTSFSALRKYIDEPEYLKYTKPQVPVYDLLNIQMKCYDFTVLEHYARHVHRIAQHMDIDVVDAWATPHQAWKVTNHEPGTTKVTAEYTLNTYERNIQIAELAAYSAPLFFEVIQSSLPIGVTVSIHPHEEKHDEIRYIPDFELLALKGQLKELTDPEASTKIKP
ncbi:39S ribosomal protein L48, mitochondrial-like isoform X1 [Stegodyphus dumicola]|uniref:39S ribosomal protein L48, mitochondrial-like isoform X1 n=1 Tax=Stegodyphus dumicola TaxID=202533 RepID=UPI0015AF1A5B|nr:39S ribosomal protein L48, mitochondrial-like isoform X1 [Stegodyphus dumicola]